MNAIATILSHIKSETFHKVLPDLQDLQAAKEKFLSYGIDSLAITDEEPILALARLAAFYKQCGVFPYCEGNDVFYFGNVYTPSAAQRQERN